MHANIVQFQARVPAAELRRPRLLVQAARAGQSGYSRKRDLRRILKSDELPAPGAALCALKDQEERLDLARREAKADYDLSRHILLLIAIIAEQRLLAAREFICSGKAIPARP
ncbi:DUF6477 family protein [Paracoccus sp. MBLB3053]|uniref:DUF6477 family protein n=1 Tax=Paracoccus aurantius TaxID=3073814 RepID=A0ABU2HTX4_9RHOB|nr:DUF6477 family protein [Paracoccus sp. MBLB3053]MDS9468507.1 DUF6477 family protein [Paracoccus sp. MBLB3053]